MSAQDKRKRKSVSKKGVGLKEEDSKHVLVLYLSVAPENICEQTEFYPTD